MMKTLLENWNKFINEGPFDEAGSATYDVETGLDIRTYKPESVGYKKFKTDPKFNADFKTIMQNTPDNWVFIFLKDIHVVRPSSYAPHAAITDKYKPEFIRWLRTKLNDAKFDNSIVVVVTDVNYDSPKFGLTANWFLHDVIGHTVGHSIKNNRLIDDTVISSIHKNLLTSETSPATSKWDKINDVLAAIITGHLTKDRVEEFVRNSKLPKNKAITTTNELFNATQSWMDSLVRWPNGYNAFEFWVAGKGLQTETF